MKMKENIKNGFSSIKNQLLNLRYNKTVLLCMFLTVVYLLSGYYKWLEIAVSVFALGFMIFLSIQDAFCLFAYLHCFTLSNIGYDSCFMVTLIGFCLILLVKYILGVKKGKYELNRMIITAISMFYSITILIGIFRDFYRGAWLYFTYLPICYFVFAMRKEFDIKQAMNFMFGGLLASCSLALIFQYLPDFQYEVFQFGRFRGFINHTNYLYMRAIFVLTYYMYRHLSDKLNLLKFGIIFILCSIITLATQSKTGICMLALFTLIFVVLYLKKDFKKNIKIVGIFFAIALIVCAICYKFILIVWDRFADAFTDGNFINSLLTSRDVIWKKYLTAIFSGPTTALFGHGLLAAQINIPSIFGPTETHNFYIFLLYRFGIFGTIALGYIVYLLIKNLGYKKPELIAFLPTIYILLESLCDNTMKCYNFTYFLFATMILFVSQKDKQSKKETNSDLIIENMPKEENSNQLSD